MFKLLIFAFGVFDGNVKSMSSTDYSTLLEIANSVACVHSVCILNSLGTVLFHRSSILNLEKGGKKQ